jgi:hypothetical protein
LHQPRFGGAFVRLGLDAMDLSPAIRLLSAIDYSWPAWGLTEAGVNSFKTK